MSTPDYKRSELSVSLRVRDLLARMTPEEKARQLDMFMGSDVVDQMRSVTQMAANAKFVPAKAAAAIGELGCGVIHDLYPTAAEVSNDLQSWFCTNTRLGIPVLLVEEALHGFCRPDSTVFPQCIGLGATFDPGLVERIGGAIAAEMRAVGVHLSLSPVLCLARDPRWGRSEETYGEDAWLAGTMGEAYVRGMQGDLGLLNVAAGPKHFAGHGSPQGGLNQGPVHIGEREMHEVMLKAFRPAFTDGKALGAMCAYHEIDGIPCAANPWLLTELLRGEWCFEGVVFGDLGAIRQLLDKHRVAKDARDAICQALRAGVDIQFYDFDHATWMREISAAYRTGELEPEILDRAVSRVLALKFRLGLFDRAETDSKLNCKVCRCRTHLDLSLEAARKSIVLLKNERGILPLRPGPKRVALLGPSADLVRLGDYAGIGDGKARTLLECLRELLPDSEIIHEKGVFLGVGDDADGIAKAQAAASLADISILALGESDRTSGEGIDRCDLGLPGRQMELLQAVVAIGTPTVVVLQNGRPLAVPEVAASAGAILEAWFAGEYGGQAIAEALTGIFNPGGRLPVSVPRHVGQLPLPYDRKPSNQGRYVELDGAPLWPFGFGLSYTTFAYSDLTLSAATMEADGWINVACAVKNAGNLAGDEVVQLYLSDPVATVTRPVHWLAGCARITLAPGESHRVSFRVEGKHLELWSRERRWVVEPGEYRVSIGGGPEGELRASFQVKTPSVLSRK